MNRRVAILQSSYVPWKGYFDIIAAVDDFVVYDTVQFTYNDWRNRNQIKTAHGKKWLTVPVRNAPLETSVDAIMVAEARCFQKHWRSFTQSYAKADRIDWCTERLGPVFDGLHALPRLSEVNVALIRAICDLLGIRTRIHSARSFDLPGDRNQRLLALCRQLGASSYLSGPAARSYLSDDAFSEAGIAVEWMDYSGYSEYRQPHPPFDHHVSVLDLLACTGPDARRHLHY